jgi:hypothetical protein
MIVLICERMSEASSGHWPAKLIQQKDRHPQHLIKRQNSTQRDGVDCVCAHVTEFVISDAVRIFGSRHVFDPYCMWVACEGACMRLANSEIIVGMFCEMLL